MIHPACRSSKLICKPRSESLSLEHNGARWQWLSHFLRLLFILPLAVPATCHQDTSQAWKCFHEDYLRCALMTDILAFFFFFKECHSCGSNGIRTKKFVHKILAECQKQTAAAIINTVLCSSQIRYAQHCLSLLYYTCILDFIYNPTIRRHPEEDGVHFASGFSQGFIRISPLGVFPLGAGTDSSGLLRMDLNLLRRI